MTRTSYNTYGQMVAQAKADEFERELKGADPVPDCPLTLAVFVVLMIPVVLALVVLVML